MEAGRDKCVPMSRSNTEDVYFICGDSRCVAMCCFLQRRMLSPFNIGILQRPVVCREPFVPSHGSKDLTRLPFNARTHRGVLLPEDRPLTLFILYEHYSPPLPHPTCKRAKTNARNPFDLGFGETARRAQVGPYAVERLGLEIEA